MSLVGKCMFLCLILFQYPYAPNTFDPSRPIEGRVARLRTPRPPPLTDKYPDPPVDPNYKRWAWTVFGFNMNTLETKVEWIGRIPPDGLHHKVLLELNSDFSVIETVNLPIVALQALPGLSTVFSCTLSWTFNSQSTLWCNPLNGYSSYPFIFF